VTFLSLKETLFYGLTHLLFSKHEGEPSHFTDFLHSNASTTTGQLEIPLSKKVSASEILYVSAIPQQLFNRGRIAGENANPKVALSDVSKQIVSQLRNNKSKIINNAKKHRCCERDHKDINIFIISQLWDAFEIETNRSGWISFCLSEAGVDAWLKHINCRLSNLINELPCQRKTSSFHPQLGDSRAWQMQYTHARCCCLLRLWNAQVDSLYQVGNDTPLFLEGAFRDRLGRGHVGGERDRTLASSASRSASRPVIHALIHLIDLAESDLFWIPYHWPSKQYFLLLEATAQLCQSFEQFLSMDLSGFGNVDNTGSALLKLEYQSRFSLTLIVQKTLKVLMERHLAIRAPAEL